MYGDQMRPFEYLNSTKSIKTHLRLLLSTYVKDFNLDSVGEFPYLLGVLAEIKFSLGR